MRVGPWDRIYPDTNTPGGTRDTDPGCPRPGFEALAEVLALAISVRSRNSPTLPQHGYFVSTFVACRSVAGTLRGPRPAFSICTYAQPEKQARWSYSSLKTDSDPDLDFLTALKRHSATWK